MCFQVTRPLSVHPFVNTYTHILRYAIYLVKDFNEIWHEYSSHEWALSKRFSRSDVKGQGRVRPIKINVHCRGIHCECVASRLSPVLYRAVF